VFSGAHIVKAPALSATTLLLQHQLYLVWFLWLQWICLLSWQVASEA